VSVELIIFGLGGLAVLFIVWRVFRAGKMAERGQAEGAARDKEREMANEMTRRVEPGETEDKLGDGTF